MIGPNSALLLAMLAVNGQKCQARAHQTQRPRDAGHIRSKTSLAVATFLLHDAQCFAWVIAAGHMSRLCLIVFLIITGRRLGFRRFSEAIEASENW